MSKCAACGVKFGSKDRIKIEGDRIFHLEHFEPATSPNEETIRDIITRMTP